jgi:hypothetical protein
MGLIVPTIKSYCCGADVQADRSDRVGLVVVLRAVGLNILLNGTTLRPGN